MYLKSKEKYLPSTDSVPKCPQLLGLSQAYSFQAGHVLGRDQSHGPSLLPPVGAAVGCWDWRRSRWGCRHLSQCLSGLLVLIPPALPPTHPTRVAAVLSSYPTGEFCPLQRFYKHSPAVSLLYLFNFLPDTSHLSATYLSLSSAATPHTMCPQLPSSLVTTFNRTPGCRCHQAAGRSSRCSPRGPEHACSLCRSLIKFLAVGMGPALSHSRKVGCSLSPTCARLHWVSVDSPDCPLRGHSSSFGAGLSRWCLGMK